MNCLFFPSPTPKDLCSPLSTTLQRGIEPFFSFNWQWYSWSHSKKKKWGKEDQLSATSSVGLNIKLLLYKSLKLQSLTNLHGNKSHWFQGDLSPTKHVPGWWQSWVFVQIISHFILIGAVSNFLEYLIGNNFKRKRKEKLCGLEKSPAVNC